MTPLPPPPTPAKGLHSIFALPNPFSHEIKQNMFEPKFVRLDCPNIIAVTDEIIHSDDKWNSDKVTSNDISSLFSLPWKHYGRNTLAL